MNWFLLIVVFVTGVALIAIFGLLWFIRMLVMDSEELGEEHEHAQSRHGSFYSIFNPFAWRRRGKTAQLFYRRDARGRFRKIKRY